MFNQSFIKISDKEEIQQLDSAEKAGNLPSWGNFCPSELRGSEMVMG